VIPLLLALAAAQPSTAQPSQQACAALVRSAPARAVELGNDWLVKGGGLHARQCLGLAYAQLGRWAPAGTAFEQAAAEAEAKKDPAVADLWVQAGNAWLAGGDAARARKAFDAALANPALTAELRGEVHLDRARSAVVAGDLASARADIDQGLKLVPADPFAWYLSSALALREQKVARAREDIAKAISLAPDDADVLLQAGNVAGVGGEAVAARSFFEKAARAAPDSPAGKAARAALAAGPDAAPAPKEK
jgi:tetratricopeptide (TPR) repeat protein